MSKRISVVFCLLLVVAMAFSIVGCSQPADNSAGSASSGDASASTGDSSEPVNLEFWDMAWGPAENYPPTAEAIIEKYTTEVAPNVSINYTNPVSYTHLNQLRNVIYIYDEFTKKLILPH